MRSDLFIYSTKILSNLYRIFVELTASLVLSRTRFTERVDSRCIACHRLMLRSPGSGLRRISVHATDGCGRVIGLQMAALPQLSEIPRFDRTQNAPCHYFAVRARVRLRAAHCRMQAYDQGRRRMAAHGCHGRPFRPQHHYGHASSPEPRPAPSHVPQAPPSSRASPRASPVYSWTAI